VSWVQLGAGEVLAPRALGAESVMIVYAGSADVVGDSYRTVAAEDVVVIPCGCLHGFVGGPQGLSALSIQLGDEPRSEPAEVSEAARRGLSQLLDYNARRAEAFGRRALFELLGADDCDPQQAALCHRALGAWSARCGALLVVRQAHCTDPKYVQSFVAQSVAQLERGALSDGLTQALGLVDPILTAFADWFTRQMYVLDNLEKAALVDLVLVRANAALGVVDEACLGWLDGARDGGTLSLRGQTPRTYERLQQLIAEAWDMVDAMSDRIALLATSG
jgi:hypothetical protein